jgi:hypothetical protein
MAQDKKASHGKTESAAIDGFWQIWHRYGMRQQRGKPRWRRVEQALALC